MGLLIRTLLDITLLRKGPDAIPASWLLFVIAFLLRYAGVAVVAELGGVSLSTVQVDLVFLLLELTCFAAIVVLRGKSERLSPTLTSIVGVDAIFVFAMAVILLVGRTFFGAESVGPAIDLLQIWSVVVKGHIIALSVDWHWYGGLLVSLAIYLFQKVLLAAFFGAG